jgi:hypothetical protein
MKAMRTLFAAWAREGENLVKGGEATDYRLKKSFAHPYVWVAGPGVTAT